MNLSMDLYHRRLLSLCRDCYHLSIRLKRSNRYDGCDKSHGDTVLFDFLFLSVLFFSFLFFFVIVVSVLFFSLFFFCRFVASCIELNFTIALITIQRCDNSSFRLI